MIGGVIAASSRVRSERGRRAPASSLLLFTVALLTACAPEPPKQQPADTIAGAPAETPAPAPAGPPGTPAPAGLAPLTAEGWGPLKIGMTLAQITAALGPDADPEAVGGAEPESCDQFRPARAPEGMLVMVEQGRLTRISLIRAARVKTDRGLGLGAAAAEVRAAYGRTVQALPHKYVEAPAEYLTVWAEGGGPPGRAAPPPFPRHRL